MSKSSTRIGRDFTITLDDVMRIGSLLCAVLVLTTIRIVLNLDVKRGAFWQTEYRLPRFQRFDFWQQHVFFPVDPLEILLQPKLRPT